MDSFGAWANWSTLGDVGISLSNAYNEIHVSCLAYLEIGNTLYLPEDYNQRVQVFQFTG